MGKPEPTGPNAIDTVPLCADCKFAEFSCHTWLCHHAKVNRLDPVSGGVNCYRVRLVLCGNEGELFEPRPPSWWQRLWR